MGSKLILLLGLIVGGLLTFFCVNEDKREQLLNYKNSLLHRDVAVSNHKIDTINTNLKERTSEPKKVEEELNMEALIGKDMVDDKNLILTEDINETQEVPIDTKDESMSSLPNILKETQEEISTLLTETPIYFEVSSSNIQESSQKELIKIIVALKTVPSGTVVMINGHTDAIGKASFNKSLSQKRADAVKFYLKKGGLNHLIIKSKGYGEEQSLVSNPNDKKNRRVEIELKRGE